MTHMKAIISGDIRRFHSAKWELAAAMMIVFLIGCSGTCLGQRRAANKASREPVYKCDTDGVQLQGTIIARTFYGPPGFGETPAKDAREEALLLKLSRPITVEPVEGAKAKDSASLNTFKHVREVQLFVNSTQTAEARKMVGLNVVALGTLHEAVAPTEHTDVSMDVKSLNLK
jgi:hypothetical protein